MFEYSRPTCIEQVLEMLLAHGDEVVVLAGGTDLVTEIKSGRKSPRLVIDLKHVKELRAGITATGNGVLIGALTLMAEVEHDRFVRTNLPALADAAAAVGTVQIRNRATVAGNICNASPAADTAPPLLVYGAVVHLIGTQGRRQVPAGDFFVGYKQTALRHGELVEAIEVPFPSRNCGSAFERISRRRSVDLAIVNVACLVELRVRALVAMGAVAPVPLLVMDRRGLLADPDSEDEQRIARLGELAATARPISDVRSGSKYRSAMLGVLMRRAYMRSIALCTSHV